MEDFRIKNDLFTGTGSLSNFDVAIAMPTAEQLRFTLHRCAHSTKWQRRFMNISKEVSSWSKDPSRGIGACCVTDDRRILVTGYNGFPKGIADTKERLEDKPTKYKHVIHAEMNCIYNAVEQGIQLRGSTLFVYGLPACSSCANGIIQAGIKYVVMECSEVPDTWSESWKETKEKFIEANIGFHFIDSEGNIKYDV